MSDTYLIVVKKTDSRIVIIHNMRYIVVVGQNVIDIVTLKQVCTKQNSLHVALLRPVFQLQFGKFGET